MVPFSFSRPPSKAALADMDFLAHPDMFLIGIGPVVEFAGAARTSVIEIPDEYERHALSLPVF